MKRLLLNILLATAGVVLLAVVGICGWLFVYTEDLPDFDHLSQFAPDAPSVVSDSCLASASTSIPFDRIGRPLRDALAAAEPEQFLPMQIARSLMCDHTEKRLKRQLNTHRLSWHIRRRFSEQQIFIIYANRAYFGPGLIGVERACMKFFHKEPDALSIEQAALIAGLLRSPSAYSPYKHPDRALQRRNKVLELLVAQGKLSTGDASRLEATPLGTQ